MNIHEQILKNKINQTNDDELLFCKNCLDDLNEKLSDLKIVNEQSVYDFCDLFNLYRKRTAYIYERRKNSGQELIRSTMLEGFFQYLFKDIIVRSKKKKNLVPFTYARCITVSIF